MESKNYGKMESTLPLLSYSLSQIFAFVIFSFIGPYMKGRLIYANIASCLILALLFVIWAFVDTSFAVIMVFSAGIFYLHIFFINIFIKLILTSNI